MPMLLPYRRNHLLRPGDERAESVPFTIAGLLGAWFADDLRASVADAAAVSSWADASGNGNTLAQGTGANQPIFDAVNPAFNDHATVNFAKASTHYLSASATPICTAMSGADKPATIIVVARRSTKVTADEHCFGFGNSATGAASSMSCRWRYSGSTTQRQAFLAVDDATTAATLSGLNEITDLAPQVIVWSLSGTTWSGYVVGASMNPHYDARSNNVSSGSYASLGTITFDRVGLGAQVRNTVTLPAQMEVAVVLAYDRELSESERSKLCEHLHNTYITRTISTPTALAGLTHWWDASQLAGAAASDVSTWADLVGDFDFDATGFGDAPVISTHENGNKVVSFTAASSQGMDTAGATDGNFLHNGSAYSLFVVYRTSAEALTPILTTMGDSATAQGFTLAHDGALAAHSLQIKIGNGASNVLNHDSQDYGARPGVWHVAHVTHEASLPSTEDEYQIWLDGENYAAANHVNAEDADNAAGTITLGRFVGGAYGTVEIAEILVFDRKLGRPGESRLIHDYLARKWQTAHAALAAGNGLADILNDATMHRAFPASVQTEAGHWLHVYRRATTHGSSAGMAVAVTSADNIRFSPERVIFDDTANYDWRGVNALTKLSTGRIVLGMNLSETDSTLLPHTASVIYTDDDGHTWSDPVFVSNLGDDWLSAAMSYDEGVNSIVELADGTLLAHFMARFSGDSGDATRIAQVQSTDGGATWSQPVQLYYGATTGLGGNFDVNERIQEPFVLPFADGELLMAIRADITATNLTGRIYFARSVDGGATWTPADMVQATDSIAGWGNPRMALDPNDPDGVYLFHRIETNNVAVWRYSADRGATWSDAQPISNLSSTTSIVAYTGMTYCYPAVDADGNLWLTTGLERQPDSDIWVRRWSNAV